MSALNPVMVQVRLVLALVGLIFFLAIAAFGVNHYINLRHAAVQNEHRGEVIETTNGIITDIDSVANTQAAHEQAVREASTTYEVQKNEVFQREPAVRDRASSLVPDSMRKLFLERRVARERSGAVPERDEGKQPR